MSQLSSYISNSFKHFTNQIPYSILNKNKIFFSNNIVMFKTNSFLPNVTVNTVDYHFAVPIVTPPIIKIGNKKYQLKKGRLVIINPNMEFTVLDSVYTDEYIVVCIKKEFLNRIANEITGKNNVHFSSVENSFSTQLYSAVNNFILEHTLYDGNTTLMLESLCTQISILLLRETNNNVSHKIVPPIINGDFIETAKEYIRNYYNTNMTLDEICNEVHVSPSHFMRTFKERTGLTVHKYLLSVRIEKAKDMLDKTSFSISEICSQCGFINLSHFSNTFKKYFGISPIQYQKSIKNKIL